MCSCFPGAVEHAEQPGSGSGVYVSVVGTAWAPAVEKGTPSVKGLAGTTTASLSESALVLLLTLMKNAPAVSVNPTGMSPNHVYATRRNCTKPESEEYWNLPGRITAKFSLLPPAGRCRTPRTVY